MTIYCDTETTGLHHWNARPFMLQWGTKDNPQLKYLNPNENCDWLLKDKLSFFNAKFDLKMLIANGHLKLADVLNHQIDDVFIKAKLSYDRYNSYAMKKLAGQFFGEDDRKEELFLKKYMRDNNLEDYSQIPREIIEPYALKDIELTHKLDEYFEKQGYPKNLYNQEMEILKLLTEIELEGVRFDKELAEKWYIEIGEKLLTLKLPLKEPSKPRAVAEWLFKIKKFPTKGKTMSGEWRVDNDVLNSFSDDEEVQQLIKWRKLHKLHNTFLKTMLDNSSGGRLYMNFNQTQAVTGRMSSSSPNLQNLPAGEIEGYDIRNLILPEDGEYLVSIDLSQIEIRVFAYYSGDLRMIKAINDGVDYHQWTADLLGISRKQAKTINFGIIYGMGKQTLANRLEVSFEEAGRIRWKYYNTFPAIKRLNQRIKREIEKKGYLFNLYGRKYHLSPDEAYKGLNRLIQGTSADLFKENILKINRYIKENNLKARMKLFVHDEVVFSLPEEEFKHLNKFAKLLADNTILKKKIILKADISKPMKRWRKE